MAFEMNRRGFFGAMVGGIATASAVRTWPFRVFSFPEEIKIATGYNFQFAPLLAPGLQHIFINWDALHALQIDFFRKDVVIEYET